MTEKTEVKRYGIDMSDRFAEYRKVCDVACAEYRKAFEAACAEYRKAPSSADNLPAWNAYRAVRREALARRAETCTAAWKAMADGCNDPLVKWIIARCFDFDYEAGQVLQILPATLAAIDDLATREDWCSEYYWDGFRREAVEAGVLGS